MEKINLGSSGVKGDSGPVGGGKINNNFIEIVKVVFGSAIWSGSVTQDILPFLSSLPTNNKSSLLAALSEVYNNSLVVDDSLETSVLKTYSIDKLKSLFVDASGLEAAISSLVGSSPEALNTLSELADALGDDPNFATTVTTALGNRLRVDIATQYLSEVQKQNALDNLGISDYINNRFVKLDSVFFTWAKKPSNNTNSLAVNEVVSNGRISDTIHIYSAVYTGGSVDNFGTLANGFEDGSYKDVSYEEF